MSCCRADDGRTIVTHQCMGAQQHQKSACILHTRNAFPCTLDLQIENLYPFTLALESVCGSLFSTTFDSFAARLIHSSWVAVMEMVWPTRWKNIYYHCFAESNQPTAPGYFLKTGSMPPLKTQKIKETYTAQDVNEVRFTRHCFQGYTHSYSC